MRKTRNLTDLTQCPGGRLLTHRPLAASLFISSRAIPCRNCVGLGWTVWKEARTDATARRSGEHPAVPATLDVSGWHGLLEDPLTLTLKQVLVHGW